jgi:hypothetical protein
MLQVGATVEEEEKCQNASVYFIKLLYFIIIFITLYNLNSMHPVMCYKQGT